MHRFEQIIYENHIGERIYFGIADPSNDNGYAEYYVNENNLRDYNWNVETKNNNISYFYRGVDSPTLPVVVFSLDERRQMELRNNLHDVFEKDVIENSPGKIWIGDYYIECFVTASKKTKYNKTPKLMIVELTITFASQYWVKETSVVLSQTHDDDSGLDYYYDYPYDYGGANRNSNVLINDSFRDSDFYITMIGPTKNPRLYVNDHLYAVDTELGVGESLTIDSIDKTIVKMTEEGEENIFHLRNKDDYIFELIPTGTSSIAWDGGFQIIIILLDERSEPLWT
ncbi:MAG: hypothetical protein Q4D45_13015 [Lachnospiraceae bacterium]|nr:hypothetical protein [Lachnospiraceae bacterium]